MDQSTTLGGNASRSGALLGNSPTNAKVEDAAQTAHRTVDSVAGKATAQVDRASAATHRAVDTATQAATSAADWASNVPEQAKQVQTKITEAACASIRARPIASVAGGLVVGYLLGRLARL